MPIASSTFSVGLIEKSLPRHRPKLHINRLAIDQRLPGYPDVPTFKEQGTAFIANTWAMVLAPA
ncbi:MAG: hypothetical protein EB114_11105, partial [Betaproteobacteria bacterium]|nr:hypothetical protein [Betaproteobacteria bacterium]